MKKAKILPAIAMLLVAVLSLSSATYAWFSMNTKVTVTGMEVKTKVSDSLLIAGTTLAQTAKEADANFGAELEQEVKALLEPVSTVDGENFFYTTDAKASGEKATAVATVPYTAYSTTDTDSTDEYFNDFSKAYQVSKTDVTAVTMYSANNGKAEGYVDYVFQLKATNTTGSAKAINITNLLLSYHKTGSEADGEKAYRVAVFCENFDTSSAFTNGVGGLVGIYAPTGATNFTSGKAVKTVSTLDTVSYTNTGVLTTVSANSTEWFKVVVRLYIEGEDNTCNNETFMALTGYWDLAIDLELGTGTPVTVLSIAAAA